MFNLRELSLFVAFLVTPAFAQSPSSEKSEAQITGGYFSLARGTFLLAHPPRPCVICHRPQRRVQPIRLRSNRRFYQRFPRGVGARDAARDQIGRAHV